ncbi:MAG: AraC family ligand binding domain-containing protein [Acidobacteriia bacterium]|nr:AraC family ligand binding domain-containing protein [Terriglobia bacterium]
MLKILTGALALTLQVHAANQPATDVTNADIQKALKKTASAVVSDQQLRVVDIDGEYNVAVGALHRARLAATASVAGLTHSRITEIYHVIEGSGTLVTGGTLKNAKESPPDGEIVKVLAGPGLTGVIEGGVSRKVGPGDVIIIPPGTPHGFSEITSDQIVYVVTRMDPHKVLPAGYVAK